MQMAGHSLLEVESASEAVEILKGNSVDWLLVSQTLVDGDGVKFLRDIRELDGLATIPAILLTGKNPDTLVTDTRGLNIQLVVDKDDASSVLEALSLAQSGPSDVDVGRVLYLEDSPTAVHQMKDALEESGLVVDHVKSGEEAIAALQRWRYSLVVTDVHPEGRLGGEKLIRALREVVDQKSGPPILGISAADSSSERQDLFRAGIDDFIGKGALPEEVHARIRSLLSMSLSRQIPSESAFDYDTGLLRRVLFIRMAEKMLGQARRHVFPVTLVLIRLNLAAYESEKEGKQTALYGFGRLIERSSRLGDLAGRWGKQEFALLLEHCSPRDAADRMRRLFESARDRLPNSGGMVFSAGCSGDLGESLVLPLLFEAAERACDEAVASGRQVVATPTGEPL